VAHQPHPLRIRCDRVRGGRVIPVVTPMEMRAIDDAAVDVAALIDRAGAAVARSALRLLGGGYGRTVAIIAGPGNNGADGRVAASRLRDRGVTVEIYDPLACPVTLTGFDLVIDAAFGSGFRGSWASPDVGNAQVLAVDVPTGLNGLTGEASEGVLTADVTVTFGAAKPGHILSDGPAIVGQLEIADIGLEIDDPPSGIVEASDVAEWLPSRARGAHKWAHAVRIVAGSSGMTGAASLAAGAAQRAGAGLVALSVPGIDVQSPIEVVGRRVPPFDWADAVLSDLHRFKSLVIGPGLGREEYTVPSIVRTVSESLIPVVVDGDGLFAMSWNEQGAPNALREREVATVLTPHDGEYGLLMGSSPGVDRVGAVHRLVETSGAIVLLKGPTTIVAAPDGRTLFVTNGDQRLATAGTGDVLAGLVGALLAMGSPAFEASAGAAWIHAECANQIPAAGLVAGDLVDVIPSVLRKCGRR
jgi:hydroxyethylthiazole kinase-like uncharacterized protein yjeF